MIEKIRNYLLLNPLAIDLILLAIITIFLGFLGGIPLGMQDSILGPALNAAKRFGNPRYFASPGFVIYIFMIAYSFLFIFLYLIGKVNSANEFRNLFETDVIFDNVAFHLLGYLIIILFSIIGVVFTYLIAYKLTRKRSISFLAGLFLATSLLWVTNSHLLTVNIPYAAIVTGTIFLVLKFVKEKELNKKHLIILGIALGVSCSTKYNGFLVSSIIFAPMIYSYWGKFKLLLKHILIIGLTATFVFVVFNPYIFLDYETFKGYNEIQKNSLSKGWYGFESETRYTFKEHITQSLYFGYGLFPLILALIGVLYVIISKEINITAKITIIVFPLIFYFVMGLSKSLLYRYMLPVFPLLAVFSGLGVYFLYLNLTKLANNSDSKKFIVLFLLVISIVSLYPNIRDSVKHDLLLRETDTRTDLLDILNQAGLNDVKLNIYYGRYLSDAIYNNSNVKIENNLFAQSIDENVFEDEANVIAFDSISHDRVVFSNRKGNQEMIYENYSGHFGLPNDIKKNYRNFENLHVIQISPFNVPKEQVPYSQQSGTAPFRPDLKFRVKPGPFIEIYFKSKIIADKLMNSCNRQNINCKLLTGKESYYFRSIRA
ncbi:MAG: phospholipid carrier-dependent glycosyltransferase [Nanoarchaeota archaeon]